MKRSEMIKVVLDAYAGEYAPTYYFDEEDADRVLAAIEKAGMLPPANNKLYDPNNVMYDTVQDYHYWEPEEENPKDLAKKIYREGQ